MLETGKKILYSKFLLYIHDVNLGNSRAYNIPVISFPFYNIRNLNCEFLKQPVGF